MENNLLSCSVNQNDYIRVKTRTRKDLRLRTIHRAVHEICSYCNDRKLCALKDEMLLMKCKVPHQYSVQTAESENLL